MRKIHAPQIFDGSQIHTNHVLVLNSNGEVIELSEKENHDMTDVEIFEGCICPGFINTHCHLELSHMQGVIPTGTGLIPFIQAVVSQRAFPEEVIQQAIYQADKAMWESGIVAVGDISNKIDTAACKLQSKLKYYTFIELFDFLQDGQAQDTLDKHAEVFEGQAGANGHQKSYVPHAPYSTSPTLMRSLATKNALGSTISIHNQETADENDLFERKQGGFIDFYKNFGIPIDAFQPTGLSALQSTLPYLRQEDKILFVHNTMTRSEDLKIAAEWSDQVYWATCANANLYIENRLPDYKMFLDAEAQVTIGTDSLSSNWQLCVLEEIKTIHRFNNFIPKQTLLQWATLNGARALSLDQHLGSFEKGKQPGVNLISANFLDENESLENATVIKLA